MRIDKPVVTHPNTNPGGGGVGPADGGPPADPAEREMPGDDGRNAGHKEGEDSKDATDQAAGGQTVAWIRDWRWHHTLAHLMLRQVPSSLHGQRRGGGASLHLSREIGIPHSTSPVTSDAPRAVTSPAFRFVRRKLREIISPNLRLQRPAHRRDLPPTKPTGHSGA